MSGIVSDNVDDGSGVINAPTGGATVSSSDPTTSTNADLGTQWANSATGDYYICTDATTDANVWTNVDDAQDSIAPFAFPGSSYGYITGGTLPVNNVISKVSFTSDGNAVDVGDMTQSRGESSGASSATHGYTTAGFGHGTGTSDVIERFPFATDTNASDVGDITTVRRNVGTTSSETHGFVHSGSSVNIIERWEYAASANSVDVGDLTIAVAG